jgi:cyclopropane-fatty-acyl-phospholipid synthase
VGIQAITIDDSLFDRYKNKQDFIQKYIFPGGFLPSKMNYKIMLIIMD